MFKFQCLVEKSVVNPLNSGKKSIKHVILSVVSVVSEFPDGGGTKSRQKSNTKIPLLVITRRHFVKKQNRSFLYVDFTKQDLYGNNGETKCAFEPPEGALARKPLCRLQMDGAPAPIGFTTTTPTLDAGAS